MGRCRESPRRNGAETIECVVKQQLRAVWTHTGWIPHTIGAESMRKEPAKSGFEQDVVTGWRRVLCYTLRAGVCKKAKRQMNKRFRRKWKAGR